MPSIKSTPSISLVEMQQFYLENPSTENILLGSQLVLDDGSILYGDSLIHHCCKLIKNFANTNLNKNYTNMQMKKTALDNLLNFEQQIRFDFQAFNFDIILSRPTLNKVVIEETKPTEQLEVVKPTEENIVEEVVTTEEKPKDTPKKQTAIKTEATQKKTTRKTSVNGKVSK